MPKWNRKKLALSLIGCGALWFAAHFASAQESGGGSAQENGKAQSSEVFSASAKKGTPPKKVKKAIINFEDELVEGGANKPDLFYLLQKKQLNYKRLIKLREDFIPEMKSTAEEVQRRGSGE